jgi:bifunctional DNA-binding transcriptional regulator/antitoxin component of YhaV-PrlF toxin-antitoxin module
MPSNATLPPPGNETFLEFQEIGTPATIGSMSEQREPQEPLDLGAEIGNRQIFRVTLDAGGKLELPLAVRDHLRVAEGDVVVVETQSGGTAILLSLKRLIDETRGAFKHLAPGRSISDELIAERREEARRESEE